MISVLLPLFRAKYIGWLPMEGLKNQKSINFDWELVIAEEQEDETFGESRIRKYESSLRNIGCIKIKYIALKNWIPLSDKLTMLVKHATGTIITHAGADSYLPPMRLYRVHRSFIDNKIDMFKGMKLIFYDILTSNTALWDLDYVKKKKSTTHNYKAIKSKYAPKKPEKVVYGVDGWYNKTCEENCRRISGRSLRVMTDVSDDWKYGFSTHGFHNISLKRRIKPGMRQCVFKNPVDLNTTIPKYIMDELERSKRFINKHKHGRSTKRGVVLP